MLEKKISLFTNNKGNEFLTQLEATLELSDKLDSVVEAVKSIPETVIPETLIPDYPSEMSINNFPSTMKIEIANVGALKGEKGENGKDGINGKDGRDGFDGKDGTNGKDGIDGKDGVAGPNGSPDTGTEIVDKINSKDNIRKIHLSKIEGIDRITGNRIISSAGVNKIIAGSNITIDSTQGDGKGEVTINATLSGGGGTGDVVGPASTTDNAIARYNLATGKLIQDSLAILGDDGSITIPSDIEITDTTKGVIMKSPNGTRFRIGITNNGELTATSL